ncbi:cupin domain-containing protein [Massilia arenosa]|uniref:Cupin domain-containing protein n=1 Tax=Zemynaea arenosa TaxID=2561931 RepID=A0A4Y9SFT5_9BURK|nr:cupin domain-containing protein [Massilia arenosa]TFW22414.1 cupin domain-containing protein [Massilia arenosa]
MVKLEGVIAIAAEEVALRSTSGYPAPYQPRVAGRTKRALGDAFGLTNFGVNLTRVPPGAASALRHSHTKQDEFIYILEGAPTLVTNAGETQLAPGMCAGFPHGTGDAHQLVNRTDRDVVYLEVGDRTPGDEPDYPDDDVAAHMGPDGKWRFTHKDGSSY